MALETALGSPKPSRTSVTDGRAWLRLGLAVAGLAALALSGLIAAQDDPPGRTGSAPAISTEENGYGRWTSPGPKWRSRSQILEDAGILNRHAGSP
jgi:hypothetical protein